MVEERLLGAKPPRGALALSSAPRILGGAGPQPPRSPLGELAAAGRWAECFALAEELLARDPVEGHRALRDVWLSGEIWSLEGRPPDSPPAAFFLSSIAWRRGQDLEALRLLCGSARGRWAWLRYYVAEILLRRLNYYRLALSEIERLIAECPWFWEGFNLRAEIRLALGARAPLAGLERLKPPQGSRAAFLAWRGALKLWSGLYAEALPDLDGAVALGNPDALCWRGGANTRLGKLAEALADLNRLLALDPHDPEALVWRAEARRLSGDPSGSLADLEGLLARAPDALWAYAGRAALRLDAGDARGAAEDFARLMPPFYQDAPDDGTNDSGRFVHRPPVLETRRLRVLLDEAFRLARGCRRSDPHLNAAWMRAAKIELPAAPPLSARLVYWMRAKGLKTAPEISFAAGLPDENAVRAALGRDVKSAGPRPGSAPRPRPPRPQPPSAAAATVAHYELLLPGKPPFALRSIGNLPVEVAAALAGAKPAIQSQIHEADLGYIDSLCAHLGWNKLEHSRQDGQIGLMLGRDPRALEAAARAWEGGRAPGVTLGYPDCCVDFYRPRAEDFVRNARANTARPDEPLPFLLNDAFYLFSRRWDADAGVRRRRIAERNPGLDLNALNVLPWHPCSYRCPQSLRRAKLVWSAMGRYLPALRPLIKETLAGPVLYWSWDRVAALSAEPAGPGRWRLAGLRRPLSLLEPRAERLLSQGGELRAREGVVELRRGARVLARWNDAVLLGFSSNFSRARRASAKRSSKRKAALSSATASGSRRSASRQRARQ